MAYSEAETISLLYDAMDKVRDHPNLGEDWLEGHYAIISQGWRPVERLYVPDDTLKARIEDYIRWCETQDGEDAGQLMEEIAYLAFRSLRGCDSILSYQSYAPQHDLVVSGINADWAELMRVLRLCREKRTIVVEAKNIGETLSDQQFGRLCGILQNKFEGTAMLGVFFTRLGASSFPQRGAADQENPRQRVLRDSRATQILFHARTSKYVVVLDDTDIRMLTQVGALPRILEAKIRDVEECTGMPVEFTEDWVQVDLPAHLEQHQSSSTPATPPAPAPPKPTSPD